MSSGLQPQVRGKRHTAAQTGRLRQATFQRLRTTGPVLLTAYRWPHTPGRLLLAAHCWLVGDSWPSAAGRPQYRLPRRRCRRRERLARATHEPSEPMSATSSKRSASAAAHLHHGTASSADRYRRRAPTVHPIRKTRGTGAPRSRTGSAGALAKRSDIASTRAASKVSRSRAAVRTRSRVP